MIAQFPSSYPRTKKFVFFFNAVENQLPMLQTCSLQPQGGKINLFVKREGH